MPHLWLSCATIFARAGYLCRHCCSARRYQSFTCFKRETRLVRSRYLRRVRVVWYRVCIFTAVRPPRRFTPAPFRLVGGLTPPPERASLDSGLRGIPAPPGSAMKDSRKIRPASGPGTLVPARLRWGTLLPRSDVDFTPNFRSKHIVFGRSRCGAQRPREELQLAGVDFKLVATKQGAIIIWFPLCSRIPTPRGRQDGAGEVDYFSSRSSRPKGHLTSRSRLVSSTANDAARPGHQFPVLAETQGKPRWPQSKCLLEPRSEQLQYGSSE